MNKSTERCINLDELRTPKETVAFWEGVKHGLMFAKSVVRRERDEVTDYPEGCRTDFGLGELNTFFQHVEKNYLPQARKKVQQQEATRAINEQNSPDQ